MFSLAWSGYVVGFVKNKHHIDVVMQTEVWTLPLPEIGHVG